MCPRPDRQCHVDTTVAQAPILLERLPQDQVLPTADEQHRDLRPIQRGVEPQWLPERAVAVGML